ncbi:transmembrane protein [Rhynchospora pubera]|uniref:Transmembrane protein n=1 Tax=Rhynchospora pubera TaxID=906938 RepID=A0AAV8HGH6_9POAL|nr:transmembrane protein [Rhynchospora pubera]
MSGVSLAVGPKPDHDRKPGESTRKETTKSKQLQQQPIIGGIMGSLRVIELQLVAFIMVFSASGLVPFVDLLYPALATVYCIFLSRFSFPSVGSSADSRELFRGGGGFRIYAAVGSTLGLFLPLAYVLGGFARGDEHAVRSSTPHLFLLSCQILTENVVSGLGVFSLPVRALVPLLYTVRRIFVIVDWIYDVWAHEDLSKNVPVQDAAWVWFGRVLAAANLVYFSINLFGFLIPQFLPRAFEKYFRMRDEIQAKTAEDKRARPDSSAAGVAKQD